MPVRRETAAPRSQVKHSITESLNSLQPRLIIIFRGMIFSTITLSENVIFILLYRKEHKILDFLPLFSLRHTMLREVSKGMHE